MIIDRIWAQQPGAYFCISTKSSTGKWRDNFFKRREIKEIGQFIADHSDKDIYFCPHGFTEPQRRKEFALMPKLLWSDLDEADPRTIKIKPTVAIESSPGRFVGLWFIDREMDEELNRRLSYAVGADKSGWDLTQVLRVPGTRNYKYNSVPRVHLLWQDGPSYKCDELEKKLPGVKKNKKIESSDASELFKKYQKKLPHWLRRELINGQPTQGKRSEMIWKMENAMIEAGVDTEDAFVMIKASAWNKFAGRNNEDEQLRRELDKVVDSHMSADRSVVGEDEDNGLIFRSMSEVEEENIEWIVFPYIAKGELTIVEGDPGLGKSYMVQMWAAAIADGQRIPSTKRQATVKGKVIYFDIENSAGSVTKKRLITNGLINMKNFIQCEEPFSIANDDLMEQVTDYLDKHRPAMIVFDPLNTYLGTADAYKGHEAQQVFAKFRKLAKQFHCSVVVIRHLTKSSKERAMYRGQGSISFSGLARVVITVGVSPEDHDVRVMAVNKINVTDPSKIKALTFTIESLPDTLKSQDQSKFKWGEFIDLSADDIVASPVKKKGPSEKEGAVEFLKQVLEDEGMETEKLIRMAEARSINRRMLYRAAEELGVDKKIRGFGKAKRSYWTLPIDGESK